MGTRFEATSNTVAACNSPVCHQHEALRVGELVRDDVIPLTLHKRAAWPETNLISQLTCSAVSENCIEIGYVFFSALGIRV